MSIDRSQILLDLPHETGYYMWHILDLNYLKVGLVQITCDDANHLKYLAGKQRDKETTFFVYSHPFNPMCTFTMYHQANDVLPPMMEDGLPIVDGYAPFDFRMLDYTPRRRLNWATSHGQH